MENVIKLTIAKKQREINEWFEGYFADRYNGIAKFEYEVCGDYIFILGWAVREGECFTHAYKMLTVSICGEQLYENHNIVNSFAYSLEDVKQETKKYFNHYAQEFNNLK